MDRAEPLPSGTVTFLFTDIEGSTRLWEQHPDAMRAAVARGGQVLLSLATEELVRETLPEGARLRDLGLVRLQDLANSEHVFQLAHPDLPGEFPALRSLDALPNNLPLQLTSFIGREQE